MEQSFIRATSLFSGGFGCGNSVKLSRAPAALSALNGQGEASRSAKELSFQLSAAQEYSRRRDSVECFSIIFSRAVDGEDNDFFATTFDELRDLAFRQNSLFYHAANVRELKDQGVLTTVLKRVQDVKPVNYDTALDLRQTTTITLAPAAFGLERIARVRMLPNIFQEGRDFKIETSDDSGVATVVILDPDLFKGKQVLFAVGG